MSYVHFYHFLAASRSQILIMLDKNPFSCSVILSCRVQCDCIFVAVHKPQARRKIPFAISAQDCAVLTGELLKCCFPSSLSNLGCLLVSI